MNIYDFVHSPDRFALRPQPSTNALVTRNAVMEGALHNILVEAYTDTIWLVIDLRGVVTTLDANNTALVGYHGVRNMSWGDENPFQRGWLTIWLWEPQLQIPGELGVSITLNRSTMKIVATSGEFHVGDVPGASDAPPDFLRASNEELYAGMQGAMSSFSPEASSYWPFNPGRDPQPELPQIPPAQPALPANSSPFPLALPPVSSDNH